MGFSKDKTPDNLEIEIEEVPPVPVHSPEDRTPGFEQPGAKDAKPEGESRGKTLTPEQLAINRRGVEQTARLLGNILEALTRIPEMNFNELEVKLMADAWAPFFPAGSPLSQAIIATVVVAGGKAGVYFAHRHKEDEPPSGAGVPAR